MAVMIYYDNVYNGMVNYNDQARFSISTGDRDSTMLGYTGATYYVNRCLVVCSPTSSRVVLIKTSDHHKT